MDETTADRLAIAATQLGMTTDRIIHGGVTADDLTSVAHYLIALTEHGHQITSLALRAVQNADIDHPTRDGPHGHNAQVAFGHAEALFNVAVHFASDAEHNMNAIHPDDTP